MVTTAKGSYDPVKAIEGMFNGSVTRIAYALKDPSGYSGSTKTVLAECAKRFHDALDDCEIQLLDAKWYLENQLRTNQLRREAKARELGTATKRKHEETQDKTEPDTAVETVAKKAKVEDKIKQDETTEVAKPKAQLVAPKPTAQNSVKEQLKAPAAQQKLEKEEKPKDNPPTQSAQPIKPLPQAASVPKPSEPAKPVESANPLPTRDEQSSRPSQLSQPSHPTQPPVQNADDFAKPTPQATPTGTNDDFFESMFGEPMAEAAADSNKDTADLDFDFTTGDMMGDSGAFGNQDSNSLDSLLPGVESYANQSDDNLLTMGLNINNNNSNDGSKNNNDNNNHPRNPQNANDLPSFTNDFDLPDLGESNVFDDMLNDEMFNAGGTGGGNYEDNIDLSDSALLDLDFDSFQ